MMRWTQIQLLTHPHSFPLSTVDRLQLLSHSFTHKENTWSPQSCGTQIQNECEWIRGWWQQSPSYAIPLHIVRHSFSSWEITNDRWYWWNAIVAYLPTMLHRNMAQQQQQQQQHQHFKNHHQNFGRKSVKHGPSAAEKWCIEQIVLLFMITVHVNEIHKTNTVKYYQKYGCRIARRKCETGSKPEKKHENNNNETSERN